MEVKGDRETDSLETGFMISTIIRETLPKIFREVFPHFTVNIFLLKRRFQGLNLTNSSSC